MPNRFKKNKMLKPTFLITILAVQAVDKEDETHQKHDKGCSRTRLNSELRELMKRKPQVKDKFQDAANFFHSHNHDVHGLLDCMLHQMNFRSPVYSRLSRGPAINNSARFGRDPFWGKVSY